MDTQVAVDVEYEDTEAYVQASDVAVNVEYESTEAEIRVTNLCIMVEYIPKTGNCGINDMGLVTYYEFASSQLCYLSRADEAGISVTGELTFGCWILMNTLCRGKVTPVMGKWYSGGDQRSFVIYKAANDSMTLSISADGIAVSATVNDGGANFQSDRWMYVVGRFTPSTELALFVDGNWYRNTTAIPATLFDSTEQLEVARYDHYYYLDGGVCHAFLSAMALDDAEIEANYYHAKAMFNKHFS